MEIYLFKTSNDPNQVTKNFDTLTIGSVSTPYLLAEGTLRVPTDVLNPVITIDIKKLKDSHDDPAPTTDIHECILGAVNYANITDFGSRYYFITGFRAINADLIELSLKCDVLYTHKDLIRASTAYVERNENDYSDLLVDDLRPLTNEKSTRAEKLTPNVYDSSTDCVPFALPTASTPSTSLRYIYVTALITNDALTAIAVKLNQDYPLVFPSPIDGANYVMSYDQTNLGQSNILNGTFFNKTNYANMISGNTMNRITFILDFASFQHLQSKVLADSSLKSYIIGAVALPIETYTDVVNASTYDIKLMVGGVSITDGNGNDILVRFSRSGTLSNYILHKEGDFPVKPSAFWELEPFSRMEVFIPFCGKVEIPSSVLYVDGYYTKYSLYYSVDLVTGECTAYMRFEAGTAWASDITKSGQMGTRLSLDSTNARELENQMRSTAISATIGYLSSILSIGLGAVSGNPLPMVAGIKGFASTTGSLVASGANMISRGNVSYDVQGSAFYDALEAFLIVTYVYPLDDSSAYLAKYKHLFGKPCRKCGTLNSFTGFTIASRVHLDQTSGATKTEKDEIEALLRQGVIL